MERNGRPKRIAVGLDGSEGSRQALQWAIDLARPLNAEIVAVHIESMGAYIPGPMGMAPVAYGTDEADERRRSFLSDWCAPLARSGVHFRGIFEEGQPAGSTLIDVARRERADLIVVGSRGLNSLTEILLGSVSHQLVHHSTVPVVVIPHAARERLAEVESEAAVVGLQTSLVPV